MDIDIRNIKLKVPIRTDSPYRKAVFEAGLNLLGHINIHNQREAWWAHHMGSDYRRTEGSKARYVHMQKDAVRILELAELDAAVTHQIREHGGIDNLARSK